MDRRTNPNIPGILPVQYYRGMRMAFSDWNLDAAKELGYERALQEEEDKKHAEQVGADLARYMGI